MTVERPPIPARYPTWRYVDAFGSSYILTDIVAKESAMFGPVLEATYKLEGDGLWHARGTFRVDTARVIEAIPEQAAMEAVVA